MLTVPKNTSLEILGASGAGKIRFWMLSLDSCQLKVVLFTATMWILLSTAIWIYHICWDMCLNIPFL